LFSTKQPFSKAKIAIGHLDIAWWKTRLVVHGVVDLYGNRKPSYEVLRRECSPVEWFQVTGQPNALTITRRARETVPAHRLTGYTVRGVLYGYGDIPLERRVIEVSTLAPGEQATIKVQFTEREPLMYWAQPHSLRTHTSGLLNKVV